MVLSMIAEYPIRAGIRANDKGAAYHLLSEGAFTHMGSYILDCFYLDIKLKGMC